MGYRFEVESRKQLLKKNRFRNKTNCPWYDLRCRGVINWCYAL